MTNDYFLPKDTSALLFGSSGVTIENVGLKIDKYIRNFGDAKKTMKANCEQEYNTTEMKLLSNLTTSRRDLLRSYKYTHCVTGTLGSRMVLGLGGGSVYETSITLHRIYGFPYVPGSSVKGCLRSYIIRDLFGGSEANALADCDFANVFGTQGQRGNVIFIDAFPVEISKLELDIMNPHYPNWYSKGMSPNDTDNPVPVKFYAVPENTQFVFRLASKKTDIKNCSIKSVSLTKLLETTLKEIGIGAKTATGYGWFGKLEEETPKSQNASIIKIKTDEHKSEKKPEYNKQKIKMALGNYGYNPQSRKLLDSFIADYESDSEHYKDFKDLYKNVMEKYKK